MKYIDLQQRLKFYQGAGLTKIKLNSPQPILAEEYQRCLNLGLSQRDLEQLAKVNQGEDISLLSALEIYSNPQKFALKVIKAKAYNLGDFNNLKELKSSFPLFRDQEYDFRTKISWSKCVYFIDTLTKNTQEFEKFKQDIEALVTAIKKEEYHNFRGEDAIEEAYDDLSSYISWWKGAQWEYTLSSQPSTIDLLKRAWLEQYFAQHDLSELLIYSPID